MGFIEWATSPLGQNVPIHIAWFLIWVALIAGLLLPGRACHLSAVFCERERVCGRCVSSDCRPVARRIPRHSLTARLFHWIHGRSDVHLVVYRIPGPGSASSSIGSPITGSPGTVFTVSAVLFHIIHATFYMDFWSIWPDRADLEDAWKRVNRFHGKVVCLAAEICQISAGEQALPRRHHRDRAVGYCDWRLYDVPCTHHFLSAQLHSLFSDMTWGLMYVLHGLAGVGLITLVIVHVYFCHPGPAEKLPISCVHDRWAP